jgi:hypothetical protein
VRYAAQRLRELSATAERRYYAIARLVLRDTDAGDLGSGKSAVLAAVQCRQRSSRTSTPSWPSAGLTHREMAYHLYEVLR